MPDIDADIAAPQRHLRAENDDLATSLSGFHPQLSAMPGRPATRIPRRWARVALLSLLALLFIIATWRYLTSVNPAFPDNDPYVEVCLSTHVFDIVRDIEVSAGQNTTA